MALTAQQEQATELLNQAIAKIEKAKGGHLNEYAIYAMLDAINAIERSKERILWGDFKKKKQ
jgi:hypothetical protein